MICSRPFSKSRLMSSALSTCALRSRSAAGGYRMRQYGAFCICGCGTGPNFTPRPVAPALAESRARAEGVDYLRQNSNRDFSRARRPDMSSPIGAQIVAICALLAPSSSRRSTRLAWVLRLPSAPT
jgi:hypothetical protein